MAITSCLEKYVSSTNCQVTKATEFYKEIQCLSLVLLGVLCDGVVNGSQYRAAGKLHVATIQIDKFDALAKRTALCNRYVGRGYFVSANLKNLKKWISTPW